MLYYIRMHKNKILLSVLLVSTILFSNLNISSAAGCLFLSSNLKYTMTDAVSGGQVSQLQSFLGEQGYLASTPTGYFGGLTLAAVKAFQSASGIEPTGFVGPLTRGAIDAKSCSGASGATSNTITYTNGSINTGVNTYSNVCPAGALYNSMTGAPCSGNTTVTTNSNVYVANNTGPDISVYTPSNGQSFNQGDIMSIRWDSRNISSSVTIQLRKGSNVYGTISSYAQNSGYYSWQIPNTLPAGSDYSMRIMDANNTGIYDNSTGQFSISQGTYSAKSITAFNFTNPAATGAINESNRTITLSLPFGVAIGSFIPTISVTPNASISPASGISQNFSTPKDYVVTAQDGSSQTYRVTVQNGAATSDKAITSFTTASPSATGSINESSKIITLSYPVGTAVTSIAPTISVSANATVSPASGVAQNFSTAKTYTVRAQDGTTATYTVTVSVAQPFLTLTSPNSGSFERGKSMHIAWNYLGATNVKIELLNGTAVAATITSGVAASTGALDYTLPITTALGAAYKVRVTDTANAALTDSSDSTFSIVENTSPQGFTFSSPSSGSSNFAGRSISINWSTSGNVANVGIGFVKGAATTTLTAVTANTGSYTWNVLPGQALGNDYAIFVYNTTNGSVLSYSPRFSIVNGTLSVTTPASGSEYYAGKTLPITWNTAGYIPNVGVSLIKGVSTTTLPVPSGNAGSYTWSIPTGQSTESDYAIFVYDTTNANVFSYSPRFTITVPSITLTGPNGSTIERGSNMHVTWVATHNISTVKIELYKGATSATPILVLASPTTPKDASTGFADFIIPTTIAEGNDYYVKVTDTASALFGKNTIPLNIITRVAL